MTEKEIKELIQLIKDNELYCRVDLETNETELSQDGLSYCEVMVHVYKDDEYKQDILTFQIILDDSNETYYLDDTSSQYGEEIVRKIFAVNDYCKYLMKMYM